MQAQGGLACLAELLCAPMVGLFPTLRPTFAGNPGGDNHPNIALSTVPTLLALSDFLDHNFCFITVFLEQKIKDFITEAK